MSSDSSNDFQATLTSLTHRTLKHVDSISSTAKVVITLAEDFTGPRLKEDATEHQEAAPPPGDKDEPKWVGMARSMLPVTRESILLSDKLCFFFGTLNCLITSLLFSHPRHFANLFIFKSFLLLGGRYAYYRTKAWQWYLAEFCYACIGLGVIQCSIFASSPFLHKLVFGLMAGVLTPAVIATRNSFVLHNVDKITSLFQHLTPTLVAWNLRWRTSEVVPGWASMSDQKKDTFLHASFFTLTLSPLLFWALWAGAYFYVVFVVFDPEIQKKNLMTMYKQQTASPKSIVSKLIVGRKKQEEKYAIYLMLHGMCCLAGFLLNNLWWHSCVLHSAFVLACICFSLWSGATYEIDIFAKRYYQNLPPPSTSGYPPPASSSEPSPFSPVKTS